MKKRTDSELFRELRIISIMLGIAMIIVSVVSIFMESLGDYWYRMILLTLGLLLISFGSQKCLQEHPKIVAYLMVILAALPLLGVVVFLFFL